MTDLGAVVERLLAEVDAELAPNPMGQYGQAHVARLQGRASAYRNVIALIPEGAVLVTEDGLARALRSCVGIEPNDDSRQDFGDINGGALLRPHEAAAAILRRLRETP